MRREDVTHVSRQNNVTHVSRRSNVTLGRYTLINLVFIDCLCTVLYHVGMNAAIRAAVRVAMFKGCHVYGIKEV